MIVFKPRAVVVLLPFLSIVIHPLKEIDYKRLKHKN